MHSLSRPREDEGKQSHLDTSALAQRDTAVRFAYVPLYGCVTAGCAGIKNGFQKYFILGQIIQCQGTVGSARWTIMILNRMRAEEKQNWKLSKPEASLWKILPQNFYHLSNHLSIFTIYLIKLLETFQSLRSQKSSHPITNNGP